MKRLIDILGAGGGLMLVAPILLLVALAVRLTMGRPVLFRQTRPGANAKPFAMFKFRTMRDALDKNGNPLPDSERLTSTGRFLRSTSLDELPELWNVIKGDMSLVGPRPLLMEYLPLYSPVQMRRHEVRPGLTGWAQVNGRNAISWEDKFALDVWYVEHQAFWLDIRILVKTAMKVFTREGINTVDDLAMPPFKGSPTEIEKQGACA